MAALGKHSIPFTDQSVLLSATPQSAVLSRPRHLSSMQPFRLPVRVKPGAPPSVLFTMHHTYMGGVTCIAKAQPRLIDVRPDLLKEIVLSELSSHVDPKTLTMGSQRKLTWECKKCPEGMAHIWQAEVIGRTSRGSGCPYCSNRRVCRCNSFAAQHPKIASQWHADPAGNDGRRPDEFTSGSKHQAWFQCMAHDPPYEWQTRIAHRASGSGCPKCHALERTGKPPKPHGTLAEEHSALAKQWSSRNDLTPSEVTSGSYRKVWWLCPESKCEHEHLYKARISLRTLGSTGCPYCSGKKICPCKSLRALFPTLCREWDYSANEQGPENFAPKSGLKVHWQHPTADGKMHKWTAKVASRTKSKGGCAVCLGLKANQA